MSKYSKVTQNDTQGNTRWIACSVCDCETSHQVLVSANIRDKDKYEGTQYWEEYEIVQCQGCRTISFRKNWRSTEDFTYDEVTHEMELEDHPQIFPPRVAGRHRLRDSSKLKLSIRQIYAETHSALCNHLPTLASVGMRVLIETICRDKGANDGTLQNKIDNLVGMGVLTKDGADILHSLRIMGNEAAHEVAPQSEDNLSVAFDVVEHLLEGVYLLPLKAKSLNKKKSPW